jgi:hypothetical protein
MLPNIDVRLKNIIKAVEQVIAPALPADEKLAQEQARLIVGHITMLQGQWKNAVRFEAGSFNMIRDLAKGLVSYVDETQARLLSAALVQVDDIDVYDIDALNVGICTLGQAIDSVILGEDGKKPLAREAWNLILDFGEKDSLRNRVWFRATGIDPDHADLPALEQVI